ncbi:MAG: hypothetical protein H7Y38_18695 [Armatimonadetes bacterium]|nr:hypothetical protein [Armatimonadota bacterium]
MTAPSPLPTDAPPLLDAPLPVLGAVPSRWEPPDDGSVTLHVGDPLPANRVYLSTPPEEIGTLFSSGSNLDSEKGADGQMLKRVGAAAGGFLLGALLVWVFGAKLRLWGFTDAPLVALVIGGVIGAITGFFTSKPKYETTYVGEKGVASFEYGGRDKSVGKSAVFCFDRAETLHTEMTRNYTNGAYTGTSYAFNWHDAAGRPVHKLTGAFNNKDGNPPPDDRYWFGVAAENAWSYGRLQTLRERLAAGETVSFPVKGKGAVGISLRGLTIEISGKKDTVPLDELGDFGINNGEVTIARRDAKKGFLGMGADGIYKFPYSGLGNARLFLNLLSAASHREA